MEEISDLGPYSRRHVVRCMKEYPCVFCLHVNCMKVGTWSYLLLYLKYLKQYLAHCRCSEHIDQVCESLGGRKIVNLVGFRISSVPLCIWFLDWPFLRVKKLIGGNFHPYWGQLYVGAPAVCQCCARSWRWSDTKDFIQGHLQYLYHRSFYFSTVTITKPISLEWLLPKNWVKLWVQAIEWIFNH